jgi:hypothetical protein
MTISVFDRGDALALVAWYQAVELVEQAVG